MRDIVGAAKMDESSRPVVAPYGVDLILEIRIDYSHEPANEG